MSGYENRKVGGNFENRAVNIANNLTTALQPALVSMADYMERACVKESDAFWRWRQVVRLRVVTSDLSVKAARRSLWHLRPRQFLLDSPVRAMKLGAFLGALLGGGMAAITGYSEYTDGVISGTQFGADVAAETVIGAATGIIGARVTVAVFGACRGHPLGVVGAVVAGGAASYLVGWGLRQAKEAIWKEVF